MYVNWAVGATISHSLSSGFPKAGGVTQLCKYGSRIAKKISPIVWWPKQRWHCTSSLHSNPSRASLPHKDILQPNKVKNFFLFFTFFLVQFRRGWGQWQRSHITWSEDNQMKISPALYFNWSYKTDPTHLFQKSKMSYASITYGVI